VWLLMFALVVASLILRAVRRLYDSEWFLRACQWSGPLGFIAVIAGWTTTEVGRQPWTVYGLMRTADSVSPSLAGSDVLLSLLSYMVVYLVMFPAGFLMMRRVVRAGPPVVVERPPIESGRPEPPVTASPGGAP